GYKFTFNVIYIIDSGKATVLRCFGDDKEIPFDVAPVTYTGDAEHYRLDKLATADMVNTVPVGGLGSNSYKGFDFFNNITNKKTDIKLPDTITRLDDYVFNSATNVGKISLGHFKDTTVAGDEDLISNLNYVGEHAFEGLSADKLEINVSGDLTVKGNAFNGLKTTSPCDIHVRGDYTLEIWSFQSFVSYGYNVTVDGNWNSTSVTHNSSNIGLVNAYVGGDAGYMFAYATLSSNDTYNVVEIGGKLKGANFTVASGKNIKLILSNVSTQEYSTNDFNSAKFEKIEIITGSKIKFTNISFASNTKLQHVVVNGDIDNDGDLEGEVYFGDSAFSGCTSLVDIKAACYGFGSEAFKGITTLTNVELYSISDGTIGANAFENCTGLLTIIAPNVKTVGDNAFKNCTALTYASLLSTITAGNYAFQNCTNLSLLETSVVFTAGENIFQGAKQHFFYIIDTETLSLSDQETVLGIIAD
ncbi:MAG: leucine-rich repeat domain-containing protein, partial [Clostridia bacterium]|nr:leucine-rich repeat domain-containing protein [Clostridia bacterium]